MDFNEQYKDFIYHSTISVDVVQHHNNAQKVVAENKEIDWVVITHPFENGMLNSFADFQKLDDRERAQLIKLPSSYNVVDMDDGFMTGLRDVGFHAHKQSIKTTQILLLVFEDKVVVFQEKATKTMSNLEAKLNAGKKNTTIENSNTIGYMVIDEICDNYLSAFNRISAEVERLEDRVLKEKDNTVTNSINEIRIVLNKLIKYIRPLHEVTFKLSKANFGSIKSMNQQYVTELKEETDVILNFCNEQKQTLSDLLNIYHASLSSKLNENMKYLTIFSVIFIPLTFIVGVYGTNFYNIALIHNEHGYTIMWGVIFITTLVMIWFFRKRNWFQ